MKEKAIAFWTGGEFDVCCNDSDCGYEGYEVENHAYLTTSEKHGYEIYIHRANTVQTFYFSYLLANLVANLAATSGSSSFISVPSYKWELRIKGEPVEKTAFLTDIQINFWDEVANLYQTIPDWLITPLSDVVQLIPSNCDEDDYCTDCGGELHEDYWDCVCDEEEVSSSDEMLTHLLFRPTNQLAREVGFQPIANWSDFPPVTRSSSGKPLPEEDSIKMCSCKTQMLLANGCCCGGI